MYATFERFSIQMTKKQAMSASHSGPCDDDVAALLCNRFIRRQLSEITDDDLVAELAEYGAWDDDELADRDQNERRIIWIAAGNICDGN